MQVWEDERGVGTEVHRESESEKEVGDTGGWLESEMESSYFFKLIFSSEIEGQRYRRHMGAELEKNGGK